MGSHHDEIEREVSNLTEGFREAAHHNYQPRLSIWNIIQDHFDKMASHAFDRATEQFHASISRNSFVETLRHLLENPLSLLPAGQPVLHGNHTIHEEVRGTIEGAVNETLFELGAENITTDASSAFKETVVSTLDSEIEMNVFNKLLENATHIMDKTNEDTDFFHKLPIGDETMFVALVCMGVIVPVIFITLLIIFFYKKRKENKERREEMLLKDQPEFSMDEYRSDSRPQDDDNVPDLDLRHLRL